MFSLSPAQQSLVDHPISGRVFLEGPPGCGKTRTGVARLLRLLHAGVTAESILVLAPHRPLAEPYTQGIHAQFSSGQGEKDRLVESGVAVVTIAGLAQRTLNRFWPAVAGAAGFAQPRQQPVFINHETAQYVMALVARPLIAQGYFETIAVEPGRLFSGLIDNLNRVAGARIPYTEIARRLKAAWTGDAAQLRAFDDLQECAIRFRQFCLAHNLVDFSLLLEVFAGRLWPDPQVQDALARDFHHLIADNLEEDLSLTHDILRMWLPRFTSALLIYDHNAGYRILLGADPQSAYTLKAHCDTAVTLDETCVMSQDVETMAQAMLSLISPDSERQPAFSPGERKTREGTDTQYATYATDIASRFVFYASPFTLHVTRFFPQMLDWITNQVATLVHGDGLALREIVLLVPGLSDAVLFALSERLERESVPVRSFRPSRPLRDDPAVPALLTLAALAHPGWFHQPAREEPFGQGAPSRYDLAYALVQILDNMDLVRAQLLAEIVYRQRNEFPSLTSFDAIRPDMQERITTSLGERYDQLWAWLDDYRDDAPLELDEFWSRLLDEVLLQPGFRFADNLNARRAAANLIDSARNFRLAVGGASPAEFAAPASPSAGRSRARSAALSPGIYSGDEPLGLAFLHLIHEGIAPAQYLRGWQEPDEEAVLITPPYTYLFTNHPVDVQFWLDVGSRAWGQLLYQPISHPYVLSRQWPEGQPWTDADEVFTSQQSLYRLILGLLHRCRRGLYTTASQLSERGYEQEGPLLRWLQAGGS